MSIVCRFMVDDEDLVRQTIRLHPNTKRRLFNLMQKANFVTESELIRQALEKGLDVLEKKY